MNRYAPQRISVHMRPLVQVGRPVHLYRVTDTVQVLCCEDGARDSGLERDDIDEYGEDSESSTQRHRNTDTRT